MKKIHVLSLFLLIALSYSGFAQAKLEKLINEREQLIAQWNDSESKKSGLFGNRTKKDMIETNDWLKRILSKDNQIMEELKMLSSIETAQLGQAKDDYKNIAFRCEEQVQILKRVVAEKDEKIDAAKKERRPFEWASLILFLTSLVLGIWIYRIRKGA
ncbi:Clp protease ClpB [Algoriphagus namhaensis]